MAEFNKTLRILITWIAIVAIIFILPIGCHFKIGGTKDNPNSLGFEIGKKENSFKFGNTDE